MPVDIAAERLTFNVWVAGGLGREPTPAFPFAEGVTEERIVGLVEAVLRVYTAHTPAGKRLKHLVREIGRDEFIARVLAEPAAAEALPTVPSLSASLVPAVAAPGRADSKSASLPASWQAANWRPWQRSRPTGPAESCW